MTKRTLLTLSWGWLALLAALPATAADPLWLSDRRPPRQATGHEGHTGHDHSTMSSGGGSAAGDEEEKTRGARKHLWLRRGDDVRTASHLTAPATPVTLEVVDAYGKRRRVESDENNGLFHAAVDLPEVGFYNAYLVQETLDGARRRVEIAQAELLNGTCCRKDIAPEQQRAIRNDGLPLELVRDHLPEEALMTRIGAGDRIEFTILRFGQPAAGVPITMTTQEGWSKRVVSDAQGRAAFTMIRDYFPAWTDFNRRKREDFLIAAEWEQPDAGRLGNATYTSTLYVATLPGSYLPSSADYRSYAWGLGIALFVVTFSGTAIYLYRRRRVRPFREVRFDEKP